MIENFENENNIVELYGTVVSRPEVIHENTINKEQLKQFVINVPRDSGIVDSIPVTYIHSPDVEDKAEILEVGQQYYIRGEFRSFNQIVNESPRKSKLVLSVRMTYIDIIHRDNINKIDITGFICKDPIYRETPLRRYITDLTLAVNRSYGKKSDYLPCIAWGKLAKQAKDFKVGQKIHIIGRIQSRIYTKKLEDGSTVGKVAYEVSIQNLEVLENDNRSE